MRKIKVNFGGTYGFREAELLLCPRTPSLLFLKKLYLSSWKRSLSYAAIPLLMQREGVVGETVGFPTVVQEFLKSCFHLSGTKLWHL